LLFPLHQAAHAEYSRFCQAYKQEGALHIINDASYPAPAMPQDRSVHLASQAITAGNREAPRRQPVCQPPHRSKQTTSFGTTPHALFLLLHSATTEFPGNPRLPGNPLVPDPQTIVFALYSPGNEWQIYSLSLQKPVAPIQPASPIPRQSVIFAKTSSPYAQKKIRIRSISEKARPRRYSFAVWKPGQ